jgi:hypothetical protein
MFYCVGPEGYCSMYQSSCCIKLIVVKPKAKWFRDVWNKLSGFHVITYISWCGRQNIPAPPTLPTRPRSDLNPTTNMSRSSRPPVHTRTVYGKRSSEGGPTKIDGVALPCSCSPSAPAPANHDLPTSGPVARPPLRSACSAVQAAPLILIHRGQRRRIIWRRENNSAFLVQKPHTQTRMTSQFFASYSPGFSFISDAANDHRLMANIGSWILPLS